MIANRVPLEVLRPGGAFGEYRGETVGTSTKLSLMRARIEEEAKVAMQFLGLSEEEKCGSVVSAMRWSSKNLTWHNISAWLLDER